MSKPSIDVDAARKLVDEISANLESLPAGGERQAELRAEVEALRSLLERPDAEHPEIEDRMKTVHGQFDRYKEELQAEGMRAGMFLSALGRMLGLD
jgi:predicted nuclease with TOPRIM domain